MAIENVTVRIEAVLSGGFISQFTRADAAVKSLRTSVGALDRTLASLNTRTLTASRGLAALTREVGAFNAVMRSASVSTLSSATTKLIADNQRLMASYRSLIAQRKAVQAALSTPLAAPVARGRTAAAGAAPVAGVTPVAESFILADVAAKGLRTQIAGLNVAFRTLSTSSASVVKSMAAITTEAAAMSIALSRIPTGTYTAATNTLIADNTRLAASFKALVAQRRMAQASLGAPLPTTTSTVAGGGAAAAAAGGTAAAAMGGEMNAWRRAGYGMMHAGMLSALVGGVGLYGADMAMKPGLAFQHQTAQMGILGMSQSELNQALKGAWKTSLDDVPIFSTTQNMASVRELRMVFRNTQDAVTHLGVVQKMQGTLSSLLGAQAGDQAYTVAKALELRGATRTPAEFEHEANMMTKALVAAGGKVGATDFLSAIKYGRAAAIGWSPEFAYQILPTLIQEMKATGGGGMSGIGGPGNALMTAYMQIVGGHMDKRAGAIFQQLGLIEPGGAEMDKKGQFKKALPGGIKGTGLFVRDPFLWTQQVLKPALERRGILHGGMTDDEIKDKVMPYIAQMFPQRTTQAVLQSFLLRTKLFLGDQTLIQKAMGIDAFEKLMKTDPHLAFQAVKTQWMNLLTVIGYTVVPAILSLTSKITKAFVGVTKWFQGMSAAHSWFQPLVKNLLLGAGAVGALMVAVGGLLSFFGLLAISIIGVKEALMLLGLRAAPAAAAGIASIAGTAGGATGIAGLGAGLGRFLLVGSRFLGWAGLVAGAGYLVYKNWDTIGPVLKGAGDAIKEVFTGERQYPKAIEVWKEPTGWKSALKSESSELITATEHWRQYNAERYRALGREVTRGVANDATYWMRYWWNSRPKWLDAVAAGWWASRPAWLGGQGAEDPMKSEVMKKYVGDLPSGADLDDMARKALGGVSKWIDEKTGMAAQEKPKTLAEQWMETDYTKATRKAPFTLDQPLTGSEFGWSQYEANALVKKGGLFEATAPPSIGKPVQPLSPAEEFLRVFPATHFEVSDPGVEAAVKALKMQQTSVKVDVNVNVAGNIPPERMREEILDQVGQQLAANPQWSQFEREALWG